ncbi:MAG TPA: hypothetical protein PKD17_08795 [Cellvibrionaceae bacterium]|nr:hypothetical protein [Cellvibrionaceae bacterium]HMY38957.1 hypothetical protein [Marinagarivorans sp.]HNG61626.1 hypothetical protein [Cellvibrionaceae bacterium]
MLLDSKKADVFLEQYKLALAVANGNKAPTNRREFVQARESLYELPKTKQAALRKKISPAFLACINSALFGHYIYCRKYKNGYIFHSLDDGRFYRAVALTSPIETLFDNYWLTKTALVPFDGQIVCDGLFAGGGLVGKNRIGELRD